MMKHDKIYTMIGLLLLAAALFLSGYNIWSDIQADRRAEAVRTQLEQGLADKEPADDSSDIGSQEEICIPDYLLNPEKEMPTKEVDHWFYIGVLKIPTLSLELPVLSEWSYPGLKIAPCRYAGSAYLNNMVIAAHNYSSHFGSLKRLSQGDEVTFTDMDGNVFRYEVAGIEILMPYDVEEMTGGDWDLTLFTCTIGGKSRVTVRCMQTQNF